MKRFEFKELLSQNNNHSDDFKDILILTINYDIMTCLLFKFYLICELI